MKAAKSDKKEAAVTGELSSVRSEDKLAAAMADIGAEYEEALGAEEEKQALDAIDLPRIALTYRRGATHAISWNVRRGVGRADGRR